MGFKGEEGDQKQGRSVPQKPDNTRHWKAHNVSKSEFGTHEDISSPRRIQFVTDDNLVPEEISEIEKEEETEGVEQGEPQPPLPEAIGPS